MGKKFRELIDKMSPEAQKEAEEKAQELLKEMDEQERPSEMNFMDEDDPFVEVDGKKELKNGGGMIKESAVDKDE